MPTNTHGGLLSCAHPGACGGMLHIIEAVNQIAWRSRGPSSAGRGDRTGHVSQCGGI